MFKCLFLKLIDCNWKCSYWMKLWKCQRNKGVPCNYTWLLHYYLPTIHLSLFTVLVIWSLGWQSKDPGDLWVKCLLCEREDLSSNLQHLNNKTRGDSVSVSQGSSVRWEVEAEEFHRRSLASQHKTRGKASTKSVLYLHTHCGMHPQEGMAEYKCFWTASRKCSISHTWNTHVHLPFMWFSGIML